LALVEHVATPRLQTGDEIVDFHHRDTSNPLDQRIEIAPTDLLRLAQVHQLADLLLDIGLPFQPKLPFDLGVLRLQILASSSEHDEIPSTLADRAIYAGRIGPLNGAFLSE